LRPQRGLSAHLARQVAEELTATDVVRAHARDELGIDIDELANPFQVGVCADAVQLWVALTIRYCQRAQQRVAAYVQV
jgi:hypothetical protein